MRNASNILNIRQNETLKPEIHHNPRMNPWAMMNPWAVMNPWAMIEKKYLIKILI